MLIRAWLFRKGSSTSKCHAQFAWHVTAACDWCLLRYSVAACQVQAAEDEERKANTRAADAVAELARVQQKLLAADDASARGDRAADAARRELEAEREHSAAVAARLERAHARIAALEAQVATSDEAVAAARDGRRAAEAAAAEAAAGAERAERRAADAAAVAAEVEERAGALAAQLRDAEARAASADGAAESWHARQWDARLTEADAALSLSEARIEVCTIASPLSKSALAVHRATYTAWSALCIGRCE